MTPIPDEEKNETSLQELLKLADEIAPVPPRPHTGEAELVRSVLHRKVRDGGLPSLARLSLKDRKKLLKRRRGS